MAALHRAYEEAVDIMHNMNADDAGPDDDMQLTDRLKSILNTHPNLLIYNHRRDQSNRQSRRARRSSSRNRREALNWVAPLMGVAISLRNEVAVQVLKGGAPPHYYYSYDIGRRLQFIKHRKMTACNFATNNRQANPYGDSLSAINTIIRMLCPQPLSVS